MYRVRSSEKRAPSRRTTPMFSRGARFAFTRAGTSQTAFAFFESVAALCIPVVLCNDVVLPFEQDIAYDKFRINYGEDNLEELPKMLSAISPSAVRSYQREIGRHRRKLLYHDDIIVDYLVEYANKRRLQHIPELSAMEK